MIIGITGFAGSGKNTAASMINYIVNGFSFKNWEDEYFPVVKKEDCLWFEEKSFATKLKDICSILTGLPRENWDNRELRDKELPIPGLDKPIVVEYGVYDRETSEEYTVTVLPNYTYRTFMQRVGTEAMRDNIHQDIWINALMCDYKSLDTEHRSSMGNVINYSDCTWPNWIITDLRFENEAQAIKDRAGIILKIERWYDAPDMGKLHPSESSVLKIEHDYNINNGGTLEQLWYHMKRFCKYFKLIQ